MGCDIHPYLDAIHIHDGKKEAHHVSYVRVGRHYELFAVLADVRNYHAVKCYTPKGMPKEMSLEVLDKYTLHVTPPLQGMGMFEDEDEERYVTAEQAERWGNEFWRGDKSRIEHPDWHSASWLTTEELVYAYHLYRIRWDALIEVETLIETMKEINKTGDEARFVFWFDN